MSIQFYRLIHISGLIMVTLALGAAAFHTASGGTRSNNPWRKRVGMAHGIGLFLLLLGGFGMLAKLKIIWPLPMWIWLKVGIWLLIGASLTVLYRAQERSNMLWWAIVVLMIVSATLGIFHL